MAKTGSFQNLITKVDKNYKERLYPYPAHDIPTEEKDAEWCKDYLKAIYSEYVKNNAGIAYASREYLTELRRYGRGDQDQSKYKKVILSADEQGDAERKQYVNLDYSIMPVAPKFRSVVVGIMESVDHKVVATAIDDKAGARKEQMKWRAWFEKEYARELAEIDQQLNVETPNPAYVPETMAELDIFAEMGGFKLAEEIAIEKGLDYTFYISDWPSIKRKIIGDLFDFAIAGSKDEYDEKQGKIKCRYVDPVNSVMQYSRHWDYRNSEYAGELVPYTVSQLRDEAGLNEEQVREIVTNVAGMHGNPSITSWGDMETYDEADSYKYDSWKVYVLDAEWFSINSKFKMKRKNKYGEEYIYPQEYGKYYDDEKRKTQRTDIKVVYKGKWIIGSEYVFDTGLQKNIVRPEKREASLSYHFRRIDGKSKVELMLQNLDQIQLGYLRLQNFIAVAAPAGLAIEIQSLQNATLGGDKMAPKELLRLKTQRGDVLYKTTTEKGRMNMPAGFKPIQELQGGIGRSLEEVLNIIEWNLEKIREITGINRIAAAGDPNPRQSVGGSELAMAATNNALKEIYSAYVGVKEDTAKSCSIRIKDYVRNSKKAYEGYYPVLGKANLELLKIGASVTDVNFGIKLEMRPTEEMKEKIEQAAVSAMQVGKDGQANLDFADYLTIVNLLEYGNIKFAQALLSYKISQQERKRQKLQRENIKATTEAEMMRDQKKMQDEMKKEEHKTQLAIQEHTAIKDREDKSLVLESNLEENRIRLEKGLEEEKQPAE